MTTFRAAPCRLLALAVLAGVAGCASHPKSTPIDAVRTASLTPDQVVIAAPASADRPPFGFSKDDQRFLDEVQHGAFNFLWNAVAQPSGMVVDRTSGMPKNFVSNAGVGFQLSALVVGVERGWITREQGEQRALSILRTLRDNPTNRKFGMLYHYLDGSTGGQPAQSWEYAVSTIDAALFHAGSIPAGMYFGGEVRQIVDQMLEDANWRAFYVEPGKEDLYPADRKPRPFEYGTFSLAWKTKDKNNPTGPGNMHPYYWLDSGGEHKLVAFLAACAPKEEHRVGPEAYYRLRRMVGVYGSEKGDIGPMVYLPYSGATFIQFFAHCWIDYSAIGVDQPNQFVVPPRARVDWWENSRRHSQMHRRYAIENPKNLPTLGENAWGLTASDVPGGYGVPGLIPKHVKLSGERPDFDYATEDIRSEQGDGTLAPYGAGSMIMFEPREAVAAMRYYKSLQAPDGSPLVWRDPAKGGFGFLDAFNLKNPKTGQPWVAEDCLAIDQGPLILAIENARTGLIWDLFHKHPAVQAGMERLKLRRVR